MNQPESRPVSNGSSAVHFLKIILQTLLTFAAACAGVGFLINGLGSNKPLRVAIGSLLIVLIIAWISRTILRSRRLVIGDPNDDTMFCKTCGRFPAVSLLISRPSARQMALWAIVGTLSLAAAAVAVYQGDKYAFVIPAAFIAGCGVNSWRIAFAKTERCPKCQGENVARATSDAGRTYLAASGK